MAASKPSLRSAVTVTGIAFPFQTAEAEGLKVTRKTVGRKSCSRGMNGYLVHRNTLAQVSRGGIEVGDALLAAAKKRTIVIRVFGQFTNAQQFVANPDIVVHRQLIPVLDPNARGGG